MSDMEWTSDSNIRIGSLFVARHTPRFTKDSLPVFTQLRGPPSRTRSEDTPPELTKNIRTDNLQIAHIVECVPIVLKDLQSQFFGRPNHFPHSEDSNNPDDYFYNFHNIIFDPEGCTWDAMVTIQQYICRMD